jgi:hypothetical protein
MKTKRKTKLVLIWCTFSDYFSCLWHKKIETGKKEKIKKIKKIKQKSKKLESKTNRIVHRCFFC